ncbi:caspase family protein [Flavivirga aquimarina]|uniref:Caspase family protein n=1 Tax=Flavivirga aquimarina TaxID=2027862 RepID=A0ABT8WAH9_9FLAO|nr:PQQ-binding-like beta-propeller repeat protein [Flavivirga aquimarina]MDO5970072.1 caspase family protein [Flavivirga aquimarina]
MKLNILPSLQFAYIIIFIVFNVQCQSKEDLINELDNTTQFKFKWKTYIGKTSFRTTILYANDKIYIGSNGNSTSVANDKQDGVFILNSKNGKIKTQITRKEHADNDVNGIAVYNHLIYFGNDNNLFFCYDDEGKKIWSYKCDGDVEGAPALTDLNLDGLPDVVFATENGTIYTLDGNSGNLIWKYSTVWEKGKNKYEFYSSKGFIGSPAVYDINNDNVRDILIGARNATFYAFDGSNGNILWKYNTYSGIHSSAYIDNRGEDEDIIFAEAYSVVHVLDKSGKLKKRYHLRENRAIQGLFSSPISTSLGHICIGTSWWGKGDGFYMIPDYSNNYDEGFTVLGKISSTPIYADLMAETNPQVGIVTENGYLVIYNDFGKTMGKFKLEGGVEATPLVADVDNDGYLNLIIATRDGYLYCYDTKSTGKVTWGQFRGNNYNTGVYYEESKDFLTASTSKGSEKIVPQGDSYNEYGKKYAIVIGIADYKDLLSKSIEKSKIKLTDLQYAEKDASEFIDFLNNTEKSGGNWIIKKFIGNSAKKSDILKSIDYILTGTKPNDLVYIFFSGHARNTPYDLSEVYLLPYDFEYDDDYSGISYDWLRKKIESSNSEHVIAFIDACRSGVIGYAKGGDNRPNYQYMGKLNTTIPNKIIFTAGRGSQQAFEDSKLQNSVFTYFLLKGLYGEATDKDKDGFIDISELRDYVEEKVRKYTSNKTNMNVQIPMLWERKGFIADDFPVSIK